MATDIVRANSSDPGLRHVNDTTKRAEAHRLRAWQSPVTVMSNLSRLLLVWLLVMGCAPVPPLPFTLPSGSGQASVLTLTQVKLAQHNYRVVRTNVVGTSRGFALLGLITVKPPDATEAFARLDEAGGIAEGQALALINVIQQSSAPYFILFSLPEITFRADVVEFVETVPRQRPETPLQSLRE
jgi:uncharacterized protein DUF6567